jgi:hypothetical protein
MKRFGIAISLLAWLWLSVQAAAPGNFAGMWTLDKTKSEGALEQLSALTLTVTQDEQQLEVEAQFTTANSDAQSRRGQRLAQLALPSRSATYHLTGKETVVDLTGRITGKETHTAQWLPDGKTLALTTVRQIKARGVDATIKLKERWERSEDGKTLRVQRTVETPRGTQEFKLVFQKQ